MALVQANLQFCGASHILQGQPEPSAPTRNAASLLLTSCTEANGKLTRNCLCRGYRSHPPSVSSRVVSRLQLLPPRPGTLSLVPELSGRQGLPFNANQCSSFSQHASNWNQSKQRRHSSSRAISKLAEGGRSTKFASFPTKGSEKTFQTQQNWKSGHVAQTSFRWASFYLGVAAAAVGALRTNARLVLAISLMAAAYAMRSGLLNALPFQTAKLSKGSSKPGSSKDGPDVRNGVKVQAGASSAQRLTPPWSVEATAVEVVRPLGHIEEGLRPVVEAAKREVREEVVAAGVVGRLERIMRILPVIQEAALASRDLARQASGETAAALGVSTKVNAEVVGLKRQLATSLDTLGRNLQADLSEEVRKGAEHVASSVRSDLDEMEGRISRTVATSSEVLVLQQRLDSIARLVEDLTHNTAPLQAIPQQVDALLQQLSQRTLDPADLDLQRSELGGLSHVSQQLQGLAEVSGQGFDNLARGVESMETVANWGAEVVATWRNLEGLSDVRDAAERSVQLSEELKGQLASLALLQQNGNGQMERALAEGLAKVVAQLPGILERKPQLDERENGVVSLDDAEEVDVELLEARRAYLSAFTPAASEEKGPVGSLAREAFVESKSDLKTVVSDQQGLRDTESSTISGFEEDEASVGTLWANPLLTAVTSQQSVFPEGSRLEVPREVEEATEALFAAAERNFRSGLAAGEAFVRAVDEVPPGMLTDATWALSIGGDKPRERKLLGSGGESAELVTRGEESIAVAEAVGKLNPSEDPNGFGEGRGVPEALEQSPPLRVESGVKMGVSGAADGTEGGVENQSGDVDPPGYPVDFPNQDGSVAASGKAESGGHFEKMSWQNDDRMTWGDLAAESAGMHREDDTLFDGGVIAEKTSGEQIRNGRSRGADVEHDERFNGGTGVDDFWERPGNETDNPGPESVIPIARNGRDAEALLSRPGAPTLFHLGEPGWDPRGSPTLVPDLRGAQQLELELSQERSARVPDLRRRQQLELEREPRQGDRELLTSAESVDDEGVLGVSAAAVRRDVGVNGRDVGVNAALDSDRADDYGNDWGERRPGRGYSQRGREGATAGENRRSEQGWDYDGEGEDDGFESEGGRQRRSGWQEWGGGNKPRADYEEDRWGARGADSPQRNRQPNDDDWDDDFDPPPQEGPPYPDTYPTEVPEGRPGWEEPLEVPVPKTRQQLQYEETVARGMRLLEEGRKGLAGQSEVVVADWMFSDAQAAFEDALAIDPDDRWALLQLGSAFVDHGEMKLRLAARVAASAEGRFASPDEEEWLQAILDQDVDPADVIAELRGGSEELLKEAGAACRDALARDPRDEDALTLWGLALCFRGLLASDRGTEEGSGDLRKEADELLRAGIEKFEAALGENPNLWTALLNWGFALRDRSRLRPITSVQRRKLLVEALDLVAEVAESGKKGGAETLMARQELPVLENELETVEQAVQSAQSARGQRPKRLTSTGGESFRRGGNDRWQDL